MGRDQIAPRLQPSRLAQLGHRGAEEEGWEMVVRIEKIISTLLQEAHERQTQQVMDTLSEGPEGFYGSYPD